MRGKQNPEHSSADSMVQPLIYVLEDYILKVSLVGNFPLKLMQMNLLIVLPQYPWIRVICSFCSPPLQNHSLSKPESPDQVMIMCLSWGRPPPFYLTHINKHTLTHTKARVCADTSVSPGLTAYRAEFHGVVRFEQFIC